jgi:hypothetical protein
MVPAMAAQFIARQQLAAKTQCFARASLADAKVKPIPVLEARRFVAQFEPATVPAHLAYGLFIGDHLAGVVMFGPDYAANLSTWRFDGNSIALVRGATAPWAPKNSGSKLIRNAMRLLPKEYKVVTALTDVTCGERGAIYRAAGFLPVETAKGGRRILVRYRGKWLSERSAHGRTWHESRTCGSTFHNSPVAGERAIGSATVADGGCNRSAVATLARS